MKLLSCLPWKNTWFQLASFIAAFSFALLVVDGVPMLRRFTSTLGGLRSGNGLTNSLGVAMKPVPGTAVLFSSYDVRVSDFMKFCTDTGYDATRGMLMEGTRSSDPWESRSGTSWKNPGFAQTGDSPVVGVSWDDAMAFCQWLTRQERASGRILADQEYRLPTSMEWGTAVAVGPYPWGSSWPPAEEAGNYAGSEVKTDRFIKGHTDAYIGTSPVGKFKMNPLGLYDMGGNVWEWTQDWFDSTPGDPTEKILRGGSWKDSVPENLLSSAQRHVMPSLRLNDIGFRIVLASGF